MIQIFPQENDALGVTEWIQWEEMLPVHHPHPGTRIPKPGEVSTE